MNASRIVATLQTINTKLQRKQYCSAEQLRILRKARARWKKQLDAMTSPKPQTRPLPQRNPQLKLL